MQNRITFTNFYLLDILIQRLHTTILHILYYYAAYYEVTRTHHLTSKVFGSDNFVSNYNKRYDIFLAIHLLF